MRDLAVSITNMEREIIEYINNIQDITAEKERIDTELSVATRIQASMLPTQFPDRKEFDIFATSAPAKEVGGDFYDFFFIDETHLALVMADVAGKGVPAALFMVVAKTLIKNRTMIGGGELSPAKILADVNNQLCEGNTSNMFVTAWFAIIDITTGKGMVTNAGHEHPAIRRADGEFELSVYRHSLALGVMEDVPFAEHEFKLNPGDTLFVYTDGVPEATNAEDVQYGTDRMLALLNKYKNVTINELLIKLRNDIDKFAGDTPQFDDITMLSIKYKGVQTE
jgi:sigma-B regulation protein RsbU (phosphoserine phosphatase)